MKSLLRYFLINLVSLWITTEIIGGLTYTGGFQSLAFGAAVFAAINILLVPLIKVLLLPLNLLTLGLFASLTNVLALYALTNIAPQFKLMPYYFPGFDYGGFSIPGVQLSTLMVAVVASLFIGVLTHFLHWLVH
ncbi:MAG: putative membrane protein [Microgenomates group bacterium Gr01-1014_93]|nr:MAG: putative membrane protein [Microgenomates group bacterium Gr01-1014_93]